MEIRKKTDGSNLEYTLEGRLDTTTAPQLENEIKSSIGGVTKLSFDFKDLVYISSAGLRVLLLAQKTMNKQGKMVLHNVNDTIMEIFKVTGALDFLTVE